MEESLLKEVSEKVKEFNAHVQNTGEKFNVFEILDLETRETKICCFLCELLSPSGSHRQGIFFLKSFVKNVLGLNIPDEELKNANVFREYVIKNRRRIDIVIRTNHKFIPIEVKIYAWDLENQCKDYYDEAARYDKGAKIFYLTTDGDKPSKESLGDVSVECVSVSFEKIHEWISYCIGQPEIIRTAPIREVLLQFAATIKKLTGQKEDKLKMKIIECVTSSTDNMKAAVSILSAREEILAKLRTDFFSAVEREMKEDPVKDNELYYRTGGAGLFYAKDGKYDENKPGVLVDIENGWVYVGIFTPQGKRWSEWKDCALSEGNFPNFKNPNDALCELCNPDTMKKFAEKCAQEINSYLEELKTNA